jgi:hypothetical protein
MHATRELDDAAVCGKSAALQDDDRLPCRRAIDEVFRRKTDQ